MRGLVRACVVALLPIAAVAQDTRPSVVAEAEIARSPVGMQMAEIAVRINRVLAPLCEKATPGGCDLRAVITAGRRMTSEDEHVYKRIGLFAAGLDHFATEDERAALYAQKAAFAAVMWKTTAHTAGIFLGRSGRYDYFTAGDTQQADKVAVQALQAAGFDARAYLPTLQKVFALANESTPVAVYHNNPQPGLLSPRGAVSDERRAAIELDVARPAQRLAVIGPDVAKPGQRGAVKTHVVPVPAASGYAGVAEVDKVAFGSSEYSRAFYTQWLTRPVPRALVVHPSGHVNGSWGNANAIERALRACEERRGEGCALYAVDDVVVWQADPAKRITLEVLGLTAAR